MPSGNRLNGKVCLVTGAAQGIGAEYARRFASEGAAVGIVDLTRMDEAESLAESLSKAGAHVRAIKGDVSSEAEMVTAVSTLVEEFGRVDCLVNNAALYQDRAGATWQMYHDINFRGIINASNAVVPHFWNQWSGSIINISSVGAQLGTMSIMGETVDPDGPAPRIDEGGYGMSKWMVIHLTRAMARRLGPRNIRVNAVAPGVIMSVATQNSPNATPEVMERMIGAAALRTVIQPEEMTGVVLFLASDDSAKMTGQLLVNDAGMWYTG
jgi:NAD(P)-dependent dehydrogenase (short-subunit alcohol dehydrogenase family)